MCTWCMLSVKAMRIDVWKKWSYEFWSGGTLTLDKVHSDPFVDCDEDNNELETDETVIDDDTL